VRSETEGELLGTFLHVHADHESLENRSDRRRSPRQYPHDDWKIVSRVHRTDNTNHLTVSEYLLLLSLRSFVLLEVEELEFEVLVAAME
jgi:hypothetical protein